MDSSQSATLDVVELEVEVEGRPKAIEEPSEGGLGRLHSVENASDRAQANLSALFQGAGVRSRE